MKNRVKPGKTWQNVVFPGESWKRIESVMARISKGHQVIILLIRFPPGQGYAETESWKDGYRGPMRCQCWSPNDFVPLPEVNCILIIYINIDRIWSFFWFIFRSVILYCHILSYVLSDVWTLQVALNTSSDFHLQLWRQNRGVTGAGGFGGPRCICSTDCWAWSRWCTTSTTSSLCVTRIEDGCMIATCKGSYLQKAFK